MKEIILIKLGEIVLKGLNRKMFENVLIKNIRKSLRDVGSFDILNLQSTIVISPNDNKIDMQKAINKISKVFGIAAFCRAIETNKNMDDIKKTTVVYLKNKLQSISSFKVEAKRSDKSFSLKSPQICEQVGEFVLNSFDNLHVDVHNPDVIINVEIRDHNAYIHAGSIRGAGGIPVGTGGKATILMSGGIDSPVAAYMMAKRGIELTAVHFASPPYTSERAQLKVIKLIDTLKDSCLHIPLIIVPFTKIQEKIKKECTEDLYTIIMRRFMMKIAQIIAKKENCSALITGESLGQVASQTISAIACTEASVNMPVFRPLIGLDKEEIVCISRKINTFDISTLPYEDCCTIFTPKHPKTRPVLEYVELDENKIQCEDLINEAIQNVEYK